MKILTGFAMALNSLEGAMIVGFTMYDGCKTEYDVYEDFEGLLNFL